MTRDDARTAHCDNCTRRAEVAFTLRTNVDGGGTVESQFCSSGCLAEWTASTPGSGAPVGERPQPSRRARTY